MAKKEFVFQGRSLDELKAMAITDLAPLFKASIRRKIKRGFTDEEKKFLESVETAGDKPVKTHCRDMVVLPDMVGKTIRVHTGKEFASVIIQAEMIGHRLGEFALSRKRVTHNSPGVGSTRSSAAMSQR
ncbi:MAG: 30S ribosomal protein S19 [Candidatus Woesearchaeota archaeon]